MPHTHDNKRQNEGFNYKFISSDKDLTYESILMTWKINLTTDTHMADASYLYQTF